MNRAFAPVLLFALVLPLWSQNDLVDIRNDYTVTSERLLPHTDGFTLDDETSAIGLLERKWQLSAEWITAWLGEHPKASEKQVSVAFASLDQGSSASVLALRPFLYVIAISNGEIGTVFAVSAHPPSPRTEYRVRWAIRKVPPEYEEELSAWTAERAVGKCRENYQLHCGPFSADTLRLPDTTDGHPRFLLDATYAQSVGFTVGKQVSIWEWEDDKPKPLIVKRFAIMIDQSQGTVLDGDVLHIGEKDSFRSFFSCDDCEERQLDWTLRITPTDVQDLGETSLVPELDALDDVVNRLVRGESPTNRASEQVIELLKELITERKQEIATWNHDKDDYFSLGMLLLSTVTHQGSDTFLCFATDEVGPLRFRMQRTRDNFFLQEVQDLSEEGDENNNPCTPKTAPANSGHQ